MWSEGGCGEEVRGKSGEGSGCGEGGCGGLDVGRKELKGGGRRKQSRGEWSQRSGWMWEEGGCGEHVVGRSEERSGCQEGGWGDNVGGGSGKESGCREGGGCGKKRVVGKRL